MGKNKKTDIQKEKKRSARSEESSVGKVMAPSRQSERNSREKNGQTDRRKKRSIPKLKQKNQQFSFNCLLEHVLLVVCQEKRKGACHHFLPLHSGSSRFCCPFRTIKCSSSVFVDIAVTSHTKPILLLFPFFFFFSIRKSDRAQERKKNCMEK